MANDVTKSGTLESEASIDHSLAIQYTESAKADQIKAEALQQHAAELEAENAKEEIMSEADLVKEEEYHAKAFGEQAEVDALAIEAAANEDIYLEESEKAVAEGAAAAKDLTETGSDTAGVAICEFIPFIDIVCDIVGTVAAIGLQSQAAKLTAQSVFDATAAVAAKAEEEELLAEIEILEEETIQDEGLAGGYAADAESEEALAAEEKAEAEREEGEAMEIFAKSKEEEFMAEDEAGKAEGEEMEAGRETGNAMRHGLSAFKDAALAGVFSFMAMSFFLIRLLVAIIIPGGIAIVGFIPYTMTLQKSGRNVATFTEWGRNAVATIPKREISYFAGHCGIFLLTMIALGPQLSLLDHLQILNQGGVILGFAAIAALVQSLLLHLLPLVVSVCKADDQRPAAMAILSSLISTTARGVLYLVPLFLMELCELRLLSSDFFFATDFSRLAITCLCGALLIVGIIFAMAFKKGDSNAKESCSTITMDEDAEASESSNLLQNGDKTYNGCCDEEISTREVSTQIAVEKMKPGAGSYVTKFVAMEAGSAGVAPRVSFMGRLLGSVISAATISFWAVHQYITDLKLPFEILVATCMFVKLRECSPIISQLLPRILESHPHFIMECVGGLVMVSLIMWCLQSSKNHGHVGIWTGNVGNGRSALYL